MTTTEQAPVQARAQEALYLPEHAPDIKGVISEAIRVKQADNNDPLRLAAAAESRRESNEELEAVVDTIVGIKLLGVATGDEELVKNAEQIFIGAASGDAAQEAIAKQGLDTIIHHDPGGTRKRRHVQYLRETWGEEAVEEIYSDPEQLGYQHLSVVHATNHLPRRSGDGTQHIDDRFTGSGHGRSTVHVALNAQVESSSFSADWSDRKFVIVAPMDKVVELNGDPTSLIGHDTWWETMPNRGLVLPKDAIVVRPGASDVVQYLPDSREVRYKAGGITSDDVDTLCGMASDYELKQLAQALDVSLHLNHNHHSPGKLGDTTLRQYETILSPEQRQLVLDQFRETMETEPSKGQHGFTDLAKRVAVRLALEAQGREVIEPKTTMSSDFMSQEISDDLAKLRLSKNSNEGHHSESTVGMLERLVRNYVQQGVFTGSEDVRRSIAEDIREQINFIDRGTLHMYYRLGLL